MDFHRKSMGFYGFPMGFPWFSHGKVPSAPGAGPSWWVGLTSPAAMLGVCRAPGAPGGEFAEIYRKARGSSHES